MAVRGVTQPAQLCLVRLAAGARRHRIDERWPELVQGLIRRSLRRKSLGAHRKLSQELLAAIDQVTLVELSENPRPRVLRAVKVLQLLTCTIDGAVAGLRDLSDDAVKDVSCRYEVDDIQEALQALQLGAQVRALSVSLSKRLIERPFQFTNVLP